MSSKTKVTQPIKNGTYWSGEILTVSEEKENFYLSIDFMKTEYNITLPRILPTHYLINTNIAIIISTTAKSFLRAFDFILRAR